MIATIIVLACAVLFLVIAFRKMSKAEKEYEATGKSSNNSCGCIISALLGFGFAITLVVMIVVIISAHANSSENLRIWELRKAPIMHQIDEGNVDGALVSEIIDFNTELMELKYKKNSPFSNWFVGDYVDFVEPVEMPRIKISR